jgi:phosphotriesterase-related protein
VTGVGGDPSATVSTYRGPVDADALGWTLTHEHVFVRSPELDREYPHPEWDREAAVARAVAALEEVYDLGVRTVVDLTVPGLGRDVDLVGEVARQVRVHLVAATGWYADEVLPPYFRTHGPGRLVGGPEPLVEMFARDVTEGIGGTGVRAGMLKVVTDLPGLTPDVTRVMTAAAEVHGTTGVPITTHSNPATRNGLDQARFLLEREVAPDHLVIGHSGDSTDLDYLLALLDVGVTLGMDRFGMAHTGDDDCRVETVVALVRRGYAGQLVLSHDSACFSRVTPPSWRREHTPHWTLDHLSRRVLPRLREHGVDETEIERMMVHNPRRLLAPVGAGR